MGSQKGSTKVSKVAVNEILKGNYLQYLLKEAHLDAGCQARQTCVYHLLGKMKRNSKKLVYTIIFPQTHWFTRLGRIPISC